MERFSEQNNNSARASHLLLHFGAFTARPRHEIPSSMFYVGQKHKTMIFSFFLNLGMVLENLFLKNLLTFDKLIEMEYSP